MLDGQTRHTTNKPLSLKRALLGSVNKVLTLPLLYHLHRVEDDATNRVTFDYCKIVQKIFQVQTERQHWSGVLLEIGKRWGAGGVLVNDISQVAPLKPRMMQH